MTPQRQPVSYVVVRNGAMAGPVSGTGWVDTAVQPGTGYTYTVRAVDAAGNTSGNAVPVAVRSPR
jgi:hypothetical protein